MRILAITLSLPFLCCDLAAQRVEIPVGDLVSPPDAEPARAQWIDEVWTRNGNKVRLYGEDQLLAQRESRRLLSPDELVRLIGRLTGADPADFDVDGGVLLAPKPELQAVGEVLAWLRHAAPPRIGLELRLERSDQDGSTVLLSATQSALAGATVTLSDVIERVILRDFEVELAQAAASANPIVDRITLGACIALRPRVVPGSDAVLIETVARVAEGVDMPDIEPGHDGFGPIARAAREVDQCGVSFVLARGSTSTHEWTSRTGARMRLSCRADWSPASGPGRTDAAARFGSLLREPVLAFRDALGAELANSTERRRSFVEAALRNSDAADLDVFDDGTAIDKLLLVGDSARAIDEHVTSGLARALVATSIEIDVYDVPAGADATGSPLARIRGTVVTGVWASFAGRTELHYLRDWDVEVAQSSRIPDPKVSHLAHGYRVDLRTLRDANGGVVALEIDAAFDRLERLDTTTVALNVQSRAGGTVDQNGGIQPSIVLPQDTVNIEMPVVQRHAIATRIGLGSDGRATIRRAAPRLLGSGRELLVVVRAAAE